MSDSANKLSLAGVLITTGIVFGDIGTSPLYVFQAITNGGKNISEPFILGGLSCVIWTLILLATFKYIFLVSLSNICYISVYLSPALNHITCYPSLSILN